MRIATPVETIYRLTMTVVSDTVGKGGGSLTVERLVIK
jgi:hypothetical protein